MRTWELVSHQGKPPKSHCMSRTPVIDFGTSQQTELPAVHEQSGQTSVQAHLSADVWPRAQDHEEAQLVSKSPGNAPHPRHRPKCVLVGHGLMVVPRHIHLQRDRQTRTALEESAATDGSRELNITEEAVGAITCTAVRPSAFMRMRRSSQYAGWMRK